MTLIPRIVAIIDRLVTPKPALFRSVAASVFLNRGGRDTVEAADLSQIKASAGRAQTGADQPVMKKAARSAAFLVWI
jgi:hypothetical protein